MSAERVHGQTGIFDKDGLLSDEQIDLLNRIQINTATQALTYVNNGNYDKFPLIAMATGFGKGKIIYEVIRQELQDNPSSRILIIAGTKLELIRQTRGALERYIDTERESNNEEISEENIEDLITGDYSIGKLDSDATVRLCTIQAVQRRAKEERLDTSDFDLIIVDEAHNVGTPDRHQIIDKFKRVIGFTATPYRNSGSLKKPEQYGFEIIASLPLPEAQEQRFLPPLFALQINTAEIVDSIPTTPSGRIDYKGLEKILKKSEELRPFVVDKVIPLITLNGRNYKTVIAVNFVWEAKELAELFHKRGIKVGIAVNKKAARELDTNEIPALDSIERYKLPINDNRSIQVLISPYVASEGFDAPFTEVLVWASPTDSSLRYTQYTGRLARRENGKAYGVVVDCLYQTSQYNWSYNFGMWMKGNIKQLENGLLYLGPISLIENVSEIIEMQKITDFIDLESLLMQRDELQEGEIFITRDELRKVFYGASNKITIAIKEILSQLKTEQPEMVSEKMHGNIRTPIVKDKNIFYQLMQEKGFRLREEVLGNYEFIGEEELALSLSSVRLFRGDRLKVRHAMNKVAEELAERNPDLVVKRVIPGAGGQIVTAVSDRSLFIQEMQNKGYPLKGVRVKDAPIGTNEVVITNELLRSLFVHVERDRLKKIRDIEKKLVITRPDVFFLRYAKNNLPIVATSDIDLFIEEMEKAGIKRK